jgi:integrase
MTCVALESSSRFRAAGRRRQIQFLLGHVSVQTTERYLGCTQRIAAAVNDKIGTEPAP